MTEYILVIAILFSLVVLGGLISIGNDRQRKAIDKISEHAQAWAIEDLRLKRGEVERNISIEDPVYWLSKVVSKAFDREVQLSFVEVLENPTTLSCIDASSGQLVFFSLLSPKELQALSRERKSKLSKRGQKHELIPWGKSIEAIEINILNAGVQFELELAIVWQNFTKKHTQKEKLWLYIK